ncbi:MAG TPA: hypothetical protein PK191_05050 [Niabella sp.]|nr:hypothetical protein [Niabella sp.]HOZ96052.1 hypothetical protein [Niabella sp.]HQW13418.1 hypothetical protein [Niabella sp.]HQX18812.1 hypothetical protein [Niabella sp.]HQX42636.1 hypothetical protein [Niabella sp.]
MKQKRLFKKLKLNLLILEGAEVLTRQQLKMVMGGSGRSGTNTGESCSTKCKCPAGQQSEMLNQPF